MLEAMKARMTGLGGEDPVLSALYEEIYAALERQKGHALDVTDAVRLMDYCRLERLKEKADADIQERGLGRMEYNGRQKYWKDNKNTVLILKYMAQQDKILKALGITNPGLGDESGGDADDDDEFDRI